MHPYHIFACSISCFSYLIKTVLLSLLKGAEQDKYGTEEQNSSQLKPSHLI